MKNFFLLIVIVFSASLINAQETFNVNGTHHKNHNYYAFTNATIYVDYKTKIESATLLIKDGKVEAVGSKVDIPANVVTYDLNGKFIYPSLIDLYSDYGMPSKKKDKNQNYGPQFENKNKQAINWNQAIKPEVEAGKLFTVNEKKAEELRRLGFGSVLTHQHDGIMRGTSAFVTLANNKANMVMLGDNIASHLSFNKGTSTQDYPGSLMGMIALIRQTYYDVDWLFNNTKVDEYNISLNTIIENWKLPQIFEANDKLNILRADKIGDEFETQYIFKGKGDEYQRINEIKGTKGKLIVPLNFPKAYDVEDPYDALRVNYSAVKNWELAPFNLGILEQNNIDFSITAADLKDKKVFYKNLQKAVKHGLSEETALKALTYTPANFINQYDKVGSLEKGKLANFIITSESLFAEKSKIYENWIQGKQYIIEDYRIIDGSGNYSLNIDGNIYDLKVKGDPKKLSGSIEIIDGKDTNKIKVSVNIEGQLVSLNFNPNDEYQKGIIRLSGTVSSNGGIWDGNGQLSNGEWVKWSAIKGKDEDKKDEDKKEEKSDSLIVPSIQYPNMAYGYTELPKQETLLFKNTTVWTNEKDGILENTDVLIKNGKIVKIGSGESQKI